MGRHSAPEDDAEPSVVLVPVGGQDHKLGRTGLHARRDEPQGVAQPDAADLDEPVREPPGDLAVIEDVLDAAVPDTVAAPVPAAAGDHEVVDSAPAKDTAA